MGDDVLVLGIDPGLTRCGLGLIAGPAARVRLEAASCIRTSPDEPVERRLLAIHDAVATVLDQHRPDAVAVEQVLFSSNVRTAMSTGQAAGVALLAAARANVPVHAYSPTQVKATVAGAGDAEKSAVARLVAAELGLSAVPGPADVADALAVALTHLARRRLAQAVAGTPASSVLAAAEQDAARAARGGWEALLAARGRTEPNRTGGGG